METTEKPKSGGSRRRSGTMAAPSSSHDSRPCHEYAVRPVPAGPGTAGRPPRPVPAAGRPVEGAVAVPVQLGADGDAAGVPADYWDGLAGRAAHPGGAAAGAGPVVL